MKPTLADTFRDMFGDEDDEGGRCTLCGKAGGTLTRHAPNSAHAVAWYTHPECEREMAENYQRQDKERYAHTELLNWIGETDD